MIFKGKSLKSAANKFLSKLLHLKDETVVEVKADIWKSMYPFFCDQSLSAPSVAMESLKILDVLIDYGIVGDYKNLQKVLLHKNDDVAHLALDVLRKIKGLTLETRTEGFELVSAVPGGEGMEKSPHKKVQQIKEIEHVIQNEKDFKSRIFNVLKKEDSITEKPTGIEEKVEVLSEKTSEIPSNMRLDYDNKFKSLKDSIEELKKSVDSKTASENALVEKVGSEKPTEIEEKVEVLLEKTSEIPSNLRLDYDNKFKSLEESIEELKKSVDSKTASENALVEKVVSEKLIDIEDKVEELSEKTSEIPSNLRMDYDNKFKSLGDGIEELKNLLNSKIVNENALIEKVISEKLTDIEEKAEELCEKTSEMPSNLRMDYDNKFKSLEESIEELKKSVNSKIANENALAEIVAGQVLKSIRPDRNMSKSGITSIPPLTQKITEDSQYSEVLGAKLPFLDDTPETSILLLNWVKFLMEKVGRNNLDNILEYYVEIRWISEEVCSMMANYAEGIDYYVEKSTWNLPEVHAKSLLFIEQLRRQKKDTRRSLLSAHRYGSTIT